MKEITRITTVQITEIVKEKSEDADFILTEEAKENYKIVLEGGLKSVLGVDNVAVTGIQDFVQDGVKSCV